MNRFKNIYKDISSPVIIIGALFFVFGFVTWISAVLFFLCYKAALQISALQKQPIG
jgi:hypothetical protein